MGLDVGTLVTVLHVVCTALAGLLALTWAQNSSIPAFGIWTIAFVLCAIAAGFLVAREQLPDLIAFDIANTFRFLAFGLAWQGLRHLTMRSGNWLIALAPACAWIVVCSYFPFGDDLRLRVLVASPVVTAFALALSVDLWLAAPRFQWIARPAAVVLAVHGAVFALRFVLAVLSSDPSLGNGTAIAGPLHPLAVLEMVVVAIAVAFFLLSAAKEEIGIRHRQAAFADPLTGVSNRRGFNNEAERVFLQASRTGSPMAIVVFDLDHFKIVNDTLGHPAGDRLLRDLTGTVSAHLRSSDLLGRLGGDEFAILLPGTRVEQAVVLAERIRRAVEAQGFGVEASVRTTVSVGVAALGPAQSLDVLLEEADAALYRAKARGRNRVEFALGLRTPFGESKDAGEQPAIKKVA